jgi:hypothetical protein
LQRGILADPVETKVLSEISEAPYGGKASGCQPHVSAKCADFDSPPGKPAFCLYPCPCDTAIEAGHEQ